MKSRFTTYYFICILFLVIISCDKPVEKANKYFEEQAELVLGDDITFISQTIEFLSYANPSNYWYPEEYTFQDIIDDRLQRGFRGLVELDKDIHSIPIPDGDTTVAKAIENLELAIQIEKKKIKKIQSSIEYLNSSFGIMTFGGLDGLLDFGKILSTSEEREELEEKRLMPIEVRTKLEELTVVLLERYRVTAKKMNYLESKTFDLTKPNLDEKSKIRYNLKTLVRNKINQKYNSADSVIRDRMVKELFTYYDNEFKLN